MKKSSYLSMSILIIFVVFLVVFLLYSFFSNAINTNQLYDNLTVEQRIKPVGEVYLVGDIDIAKIAKPKKTAKKRSSKEIYDTACSTCHNAGVAGAPKFANKADWAPRIKTGIKALFNTAINGRGAMPARGTCGDCSDEDIQNVVTYMVNGSK